MSQISIQNFENAKNIDNDVSYLLDCDNSKDSISTNNTSFESDDFKLLNKSSALHNDQANVSIDDISNSLNKFDFSNETNIDKLVNPKSRNPKSNDSSHKNRSRTNSNLNNKDFHSDQQLEKSPSIIQLNKKFSNMNLNKKKSNMNLKKRKSHSQLNKKPSNINLNNERNDIELSGDPEKDKKAIKNLKRKERRKKAAAFKKQENSNINLGQDIDNDDNISTLSDDSMISETNNNNINSKRSFSAPIARINSRSSSITELIDIDDSQVNLDDSMNFDSIVADEKKRSISEFKPPVPNFTPTKNSLNKKHSVSELIKQHEEQNNSGPIINPKRSVSELIKQHGGGFNSTMRRDSLITPSKDLVNSRKKSVYELISDQEKSNSSSSFSNPFEVTLRPTKKQNLNGKFTSESLPTIQSIKTIIGLSHQQILNLELSDVKIKTIVSSTKVSKFAQNALNFVIKQTNELFENFEKKSIFFKLCISVALNESIGFRKTVKSYPQINEWFGSIDEINLENTRTKLTPSNKDIHQNNFDYSVLSYFGHILIWASYHQRINKTPVFFEKYDIDLNQSNIRSSIGGYHLWDRLIRESKGMNSKRWKHIIKFRQSFSYEEDQFMLMLRFMKVDEIIP